MSVSGRKRVSKWDSKEEEDCEHLNGNDYPEQHSRFYPEGNGRNGSSRRSAPDVVDDDDYEHLKSRQQHPGEAWPPRSRGGGDAAMMSYYDSSRNSSSEQDESRQQQPSRDRPRTRRSGSRSNSRSRSRSPVQRVRRDAGGGGSYERHKTRSGREVDGRYIRAGDHDWEPKNRKTRDASYYKEDSREQYPLRVGGGRSDYSSEDNNNNSRRETQRRDSVQVLCVRELP